MAAKEIIDRLKDKGLRITNQRKILIDTILENECSSSKEIYYCAIKKDPNIGMATVYRMIKLLEEEDILERRKLSVRK
ncbi:MAG: transcriptional repressor [Lachnospiraceae bacterium]